MLKIVKLETLSPTALTEDSATTPDFQSVEYRLNNRKRMSDVGTNSSRTFAVELSNGSMIRVVVKMDQAEKFEQELSAAIQQNPNADVGNLLYELTRFFDIYDMQWLGQFDDESPMTEDDTPPPDTTAVDPATPVDDTTDAPPVNPDDDTGNGDDDGMFDDNNPVDLNDMTDDTEGETVDTMDGGSLKDVLKTLVSQLTADSEARRAEADARRAEADAQKAASVAKAMEIKVGQEKEVQEMEGWEDKNKEKEKRAKELDRLAKFRLAKAQGITDSRQAPRGRMVTEGSDDERVEAYGVKGLNSTPWRRTFKNVAALNKWCEDHDAEVSGTRSPEPKQRDITEAGKRLNEDWGSSDMGYAMRSMWFVIDHDFGGEATKDSVREAALDAAETYYQHMGYDSVDEAADRLEYMFNLRLSGPDGNNHSMRVRTNESRPTMQIRGLLSNGYTPRGGLTEGVSDKAVTEFLYDGHITFRVMTERDITNREFNDKVQEIIDTEFQGIIEGDFRQMMKSGKIKQVDIYDILYEAAPAPRMMQHIRSLGQAMKGRPQANGQAMNNLEDEAIKLVADAPAQQAQSLRDLAAARQAGTPPQELAVDKKVAQMKVQFAKRVATMKLQLDASIKKVGAAP